MAKYWKRFSARFAKAKMMVTMRIFSCRSILYFFDMYMKLIKARPSWNRIKARVSKEYMSIVSIVYGFSSVFSFVN